MKILISGAGGHMGRAVARQAEEQGIEIVAGVDVQPMEAAFPVFMSFEEAPAADVIIDFSKPDSLEGLLKYAKANHVPAVLATTGYTSQQLAMIDEAAQTIPIFRSANMSVGVALVRALARKAAEILGDGFDVEIVETHHNRKADAPSGTALMLYEALKDAYAQPKEAVFGRSGRECKRQEKEIGIHALRGGTVTGEHQVCFLGPSERITISHSAESRSLFASGALKAAALLMDKEPGMYTMDDIIGTL